MQQIRFNPLSELRPGAAAPKAAAEPGFGAAMRAGIERPAGDGVESRRERSDLDGLVRDLSGEIQRMRAHFGSLQAAAGRAESAYHGQVNVLLAQIASLSGSIDLAQAQNSPEYRRAMGTMQALHNKLADQRGVGDASNGATAEALAGVRSQEGVVQAALAQILQQLSTLQMRMGAIGALI